MGGLHLISTRKRSLLKTVSWRALATFDTFVISYLITGELAWASAIASLEVFTKIGLYYLHERGWERIKFGLIK